MSLLLVLACATAERSFPPDPAKLLMTALDGDGSGYVELGELAAPDPAATLALLDQDADQRLSVEELRADLESSPEVNWSTRADPERTPPPDPTRRPGLEGRSKAGKAGKAGRGFKAGGPGKGGKAQMGPKGAKVPVGGPRGAGAPDPTMGPGGG